MRDRSKPVRVRSRMETCDLDAARDRAAAIARAAIQVFGQGRWLTTQHARQAYALTIQIIALEDELGAVCEASFAERHIRVMAEAAHLVAQHARHDMATGAARLSRVVDFDLLDEGADADLVPAYAIVATAI